MYYWDGHLKLLMLQVDLMLSDVLMPFLSLKSIMPFKSLSISYEMHTNWIQN